MTVIYTLDENKKSTNLSINSDLLKKAKKLYKNTSNSLEKAPIEFIKEQGIKNWEILNIISINNYNKRVNKNGTFGDKIRTF